MAQTCKLWRWLNLWRGKRPKAYMRIQFGDSKGETASRPRTRCRFSRPDEGCGGERKLKTVQERSICAFTGDTGWQIIPSNTLKTIDIWKLLRWVVCRYQYWCMVTYRAPRLFTDQCFRFRKTCINYDCRRANAARRVGQWRFQALMQWSQICLSSQKWTPSEWQSCTNNFATLLQNSLRENTFNCSTFTKLSNPASMPE